MSISTSIFQIALVFFIITNPIGNSPAIIALIKNHSLKGQQRILFRESMFAMILAIFFLYLGETFLGGLNIEIYALTLSGGIILFLVALKMIFSNNSSEYVEKPKQDPFIVPISTPLLSGAGLMTMIMLYAKQEESQFKILSAILLAWIPITAILVFSPYLQIFLGKKGLAALEQLMGMLLAMVAMQMIVKGSSLFISALMST